MVNVYIRYVIFWTKRGILSQCQISCDLHICFTMISAKRQSSVNTVYLKKYLVGSPLIMWVDDYGCICTYYLLAFFNLRQGSSFIISGNNSQSAYRTLQNESHTLMGSYSTMYRIDSGNINLSLKDYSYTSCFVAWSKRNVCKSRIGSYSLIFQNDFGSVYLTPTQQAIRSHRWWMYAYPMPFLDKKPGNSLIIKCEISS